MKYLSYLDCMTQVSDKNNPTICSLIGAMKYLSHLDCMTQASDKNNPTKYSLDWLN